MKMNKKLPLTIILTFLFTTAFSQNVIIHNAEGEEVFSFIRDTPDPLIRQLPREITSKRQSDQIEFVRLLADYINEKSTCDFDRVKKVHDWVALNIRYDTQSFFSGRYSSQRFNDVIRRGSAVCAGYSEVFKYICDILEIECVIVTGYARGFGSSLFRFTDVTNTNHAWNIVIINGNKYLIDTTWNAGYVSGRSFQARYRTDYLFMDPSIFIFDHFPADSVYQLLDPPLEAEEFDNLPFLRPLFFQAVNTWPNLARITEITNEDVLEFTLNEGYEFAYHWHTQSGARLSREFPSKREMYRVSIPNQRPGRYSLRIYIIKPGENLYWSCGEFGFEIK